MVLFTVFNGLSIIVPSYNLFLVTRLLSGLPHGAFFGVGAVVAGKLLEQKDTNRGFNAQTEQYTDMIKAGIIDPAKVVRTALQDAASVAGLLITTEAMVAEKPEKKDPMPAGAPDMGGMGGMGF